VTSAQRLKRPHLPSAPRCPAAVLFCLRCAQARLWQQRAWAACKGGLGGGWGQSKRVRECERGCAACAHKCVHGCAVSVLKCVCVAVLRVCKSVSALLCCVCAKVCVRGCAAWLCMQDPLDAQAVVAEVGVGGHGQKICVRGCNLRVARAEGCPQNWKVSSMGFRTRLGLWDQAWASGPGLGFGTRLGLQDQAWASEPGLGFRARLGLWRTGALEGARQGLPQNWKAGHGPGGVKEEEGKQGLLRRPNASALLLGQPGASYCSKGVCTCSQGPVIVQGACALAARGRLLFKGRVHLQPLALQSSGAPGTERQRAHRHPFGLSKAEASSQSFLGGLWITKKGRGLMGSPAWVARGLRVARRAEGCHQSSKAQVMGSHLGCTRHRSWAAIWARRQGTYG